MRKLTAKFFYFLARKLEKHHLRKLMKIHMKTPLSPDDLQRAVLDIGRIWADIRMSIFSNMGY